MTRKEKSLSSYWIVKSLIEPATARQQTYAHMLTFILEGWAQWLLSLWEISYDLRNRKSTGSSETEIYLSREYIFSPFNLFIFWPCHTAHWLPSQCSYHFLKMPTFHAMSLESFLIAKYEKRHSQTTIVSSEVHFHTEWILHRQWVVISLKSLL